MIAGRRRLLAGGAFSEALSLMTSAALPIVEELEDDGVYETRVRIESVGPRRKSLSYHYISPDSIIECVV